MIITKILSNKLLKKLTLMSNSYKSKIEKKNRIIAINKHFKF